MLTRTCCPHCNARFKARTGALGHGTRCRSCGRRFIVTELLDVQPVNRPQRNALTPAGDAAVIPLTAGPAPTVPFRGIQLIVPMWLNLIALSSPFLCSLVMAPARLLHYSHEESVAPTWALAGLLCVCGVPALAASVWFLAGMFKAWKHVLFWMRREGLRPPVGSAGEALGYLFIPFFNLWWGTRFYGLGRYLNAVIDARDLDVPYAAEDLGEYLLLFIILEFVCIAVALCFPPALLGAVLFALAATATWIFLSHNLQRSVNAVGRVLGGV